MLESVTQATDPILEMRNISKTFGALKALPGVPFNVLAGEIHACENGAGKSQLAAAADHTDTTQITRYGAIHFIRCRGDFHAVVRTTTGWRGRYFYSRTAAARWLESNYGKY